MISNRQYETLTQLNHGRLTYWDDEWKNLSQQRMRHLHSLVQAGYARVTRGTKYRTYTIRAAGREALEEYHASVDAAIKRQFGS